MILPLAKSRPPAIGGAAAAKPVMRREEGGELWLAKVREDGQRVLRPVVGKFRTPSRADADSENENISRRQVTASRYYHRTLGVQVCPSSRRSALQHLRDQAVPLDQRTTEADALPCISHCTVGLAAHRDGRETNRRIRLSSRALRDLLAEWNYRPGRPTGEKLDTLVAHMFSAILSETRPSRTYVDV
jgi:hypothetical protein